MALAFSSSHHPSLPIKIPRQLQPKQLKHSRSHIHNRRLLHINFPIAKQNSRHQPWIHAMVPAPGFGVVLKNRAGNFPHHRIPRSAKSSPITHNQIRSIVHIRPGIDPIAIKHPGNRKFSRSRINQSIQFLAQLVLERLTLRSRSRQSPPAPDLSDSDKSHSTPWCRPGCETNPHPQTNRRSPFFHPSKPR